MSTEHGHRRKDGSIRRCTFAFAHLVGAAPPLAWCEHGKLDPDVGYCIHAGGVGDKSIRTGTPCDDPFLAGVRP